MKILDDDPFFTVDIPALRIRPSTPAEATARAGRWAQSRAGRLKRRLEDGAKADRHAFRQVGATAAAGRREAPEPLPPWREVAAAWQRVRDSFDGVFLSEEEEEQARVAFHHGGARWRVFLTELSQRRRDQDAVAGGKACFRQIALREVPEHCSRLHLAFRECAETQRRLNPILFGLLL